MRLITVSVALCVLAFGSGCAATDRQITLHGDQAAEVYVQVLRRYLTTPSESSFRDTLKTVYVLDQAIPDAGKPGSGRKAGTPIPEDVRAKVTSGVEDLVSVSFEFVADRDSVLEQRDKCAQVKDGGILITLGTLTGDDTEVKVGINGYVACMGATWLTYVVHNNPTGGWMVTGTTGERAIS